MNPAMNSLNSLNRLNRCPVTLSEALPFEKENCLPNCVGSIRSKAVARCRYRTPQVGDGFDRWGFKFKWTERHKTPAQLEPLRQVGDPLADECVAALGIKPGTDTLDVLEQYLSLPPCQQQSEAPMNFHQDAMRIPDWVDWNTIKRGQDTYWAYAGPINLALLHGSLAGGFGSPQVVRTLQCTNYLACEGRTLHRLMETLQFVLDCMKDGIQTLKPGSGKGWRSTLRVRLLHTQVRLRILKLAAAHPDYYSVEQDGVPINQEDCVATLSAFSISVIIGLERMGIHLSSEEVDAYLHLWRLIGHYLGLLPENNPLTSHGDALASFESVVCHMLSPNDNCATMTRALLRGVAEKPPFGWSFAFHSAVTRALLGDELSDGLQVEKSNLYHRGMVAVLFATLKWSSSPWWFLRYRTHMAQKHALHFIKVMSTKGTEINFNMKMVPQVFLKKS